MRFCFVNQTIEELHYFVTDTVQSFIWLMVNRSESKSCDMSALCVFACCQPLSQFFSLHCVMRPPSPSLFPSIHPCTRLQGIYLAFLTSLCSPFFPNSCLYLNHIHHSFPETSILSVQEKKFGISCYSVNYALLFLVFRSLCHQKNAGLCPAV